MAADTSSSSRGENARMKNEKIFIYTLLVWLGAVPDGVQGVVRNSAAAGHGR